MYILNTSFHVDRGKGELLCRLIKAQLIPALTASGKLHTPLLLQILVEVDPQVESYSLQLQGEDLEAASEELDNASDVMQQIAAKCGGAEHLLYFTTPMCVME